MLKGFPKPALNRRAGREAAARIGVITMPGAFTSISIFAFDHDDRGQPIQVWETVVDGDEVGAVEEAKNFAQDQAGTLVVKREGRPAVGEEGDPIIVFQTGRIGDFD